MRKFKVTIDGKAYEVEIEEIGGEPQQLSSRAQTTGTANKPAPKVNATPVITSPVPAAPVPVVPAISQAGPNSSQAVTDNALTGEGEVVEAPVTGQVLKVEVKVGEQVVEGQVLLILEAMKMENEVTASVAGTVSQILVNQGQAVESGQRLLLIK